jgi:NAD(P)-dependent dehydrogenase (short-subunit alcohol dehydrogenase family)
MPERLALVSGAASGIGRAIAIRLARDPTIGHVLVADLPSASGTSTVDAITAAGGRATLLPLDVRDVPGLRATVDDATEHQGVDILVNAAGVNRPVSALDVEPDDFDLVLGTNLRGSFFLTQACAHQMIASRWGRVVNVASVLGLVGYPRRVSYGASKGGMVMVTKMLAIEWAALGVTVNAVAPGVIETAMTADFLKDPEYRRTVVDQTPNERIGTPEDVAELTAFLVTDAAVHVTGQVIAVDGGYATR